MSTQIILEKAKQSAPALATLDTEKKNKALAAMADALMTHCDTILAENAKDMENAKDHLSQSMLDRLLLTRERIAGMAEGIRQVIALLPLSQASAMIRAIANGEAPGAFGFVVLAAYLIVFGGIAVGFIYRKKNL